MALCAGALFIYRRFINTQTKINIKIILETEREEFYAKKKQAENSSQRDAQTRTVTVQQRLQTGMLRLCLCWLQFCVPDK